MDLGCWRNAADVVSCTILFISTVAGCPELMCEGGFILQALFSCSRDLNCCYPMSIKACTLEKFKWMNLISDLYQSIRLWKNNINIFNNPLTRNYEFYIWTVGLIISSGMCQTSLQCYVKLLLQGFAAWVCFISKHGKQTQALSFSFVFQSTLAHATFPLVSRIIFARFPSHKPTKEISFISAWRNLHVIVLFVTSRCSFIQALQLGACVWMCLAFCTSWKMDKRCYSNFYFIVLIASRYFLHFLLPCSVAFLHWPLSVHHCHFKVVVQSTYLSLTRILPFYLSLGRLLWLVSD